MVDRSAAYDDTKYTGRGIVIVGGGKLLRSCLATIKLMRNMGVTLPIELWHKKDEMTQAQVDLFTPHNVKCKTFEGYVQRHLLEPVQTLGGPKLFQLKPLAILHSSFEEVLLIDADNTPTRNIEYLFDHPIYQSSGAVFWPDYWKTSLESPIWQLMDVPPVDMWEQESGQLLINKRKGWLALNLCVHMNSEFYMKLLNGDKDTFRFAWMATHTDFHFIETRMNPCGMLGDNGQFCGHSMLQHDFDGEPLFVHHTMAKDAFGSLGMQFDKEMVAVPEESGYVRAFPAGFVQRSSGPKPYCHNLQVRALA